jgi:hypothetical protein
MSTKFLSLLGILSILNASCTKELKYSKEDLLFKAMKADSTVGVVLPKSMNEGVHCTDYTEGCLSAHIVKVQNLEFIAVEFTNQAQAIHAAKKIRGLYARNWVFDDVTGEPLLVKFVETHLEAKKP